MNAHDTKEHPEAPGGSCRRSSGSRSNWIFIGFIFIAGLLLFSEHRAHLLGFLPYLFLLACPLMHFFHHGGHRGHNHGGQGTNEKSIGSTEGKK